MSETILYQVKTLINDLSAPEKAQLVEWLGAALNSELIKTSAKATKEEPAAYTTLADQDSTVAPKRNGEAQRSSQDDIQNKRAGGRASEFPDEIPWEERAWTEEEIRELMKPEPKTGAEIVALLDRLDLNEWQAMDIPDVVEWLKEQRHQQAVKRGLYWDEDI